MIPQSPWSRHRKNGEIEARRVSEEYNEIIAIYGYDETQRWWRGTCANCGGYPLKDHDPGDGKCLFGPKHYSAYDPRNR